MLIMKCRLMFLLCLMFRITRCMEPWNTFIFTQSWPPSSCKVARETGRKCVIPDNIKTWQVHGLWPQNRSNKPGPFFCNISNEFIYEEIEKLDHQLELYWRNLFPRTVKEDLWKHEWEKHGRCATTVKATKTEYLYFRIALELREKYAIEKIFTANGITDNGKYQISRLNQVLMDNLQREPFFFCAKRTNGARWLVQIGICFNTRFELINCPRYEVVRAMKFSPVEPCYSGRIFYPPLR